MRLFAFVDQNESQQKKVDQITIRSIRFDKTKGKKQAQLVFKKAKQTKRTRIAHYYFFLSKEKEKKKSEKDCNSAFVCLICVCATSQ